MRKKQEKSNDLKNLIIVLAIIVIISFASGVFIKRTLTPKIEKEYSNGFTFTKVGKFWYTSIKNPVINQEYSVDFRYSPSQVKNITVIGNPKNFFEIMKINELNAAYITFNFRNNVTSAYSLAAADLSKQLKVVNGVTLMAACTENITDACNTRPIVTCENQEDKALVIFLKDSEKPKISMVKNCLTLEGRNDDLVRVYTKLLFIWYGIL
ncbi:hypothetical protein J4482_00995 [Candidatus Woesearchaeota archaeon]|nr:hypothetical protein [Candidatus Woesearchaeota archaeon]